MDSFRPVDIAWPPIVGVVVGTHASAPYIHLHLALRQKYWPAIPLLVHDDSSVASSIIRDLCEAYDAKYTSTPRRLGGALGDLSAFSAGLEWANDIGVDLLVKLSRRFVICTDWVGDLQRIAFEAQHATYTSRCSDYGFAFRSECAALQVQSWYGSEPHRQMRQAIACGVAPAEVMERWYHEQAKRIERRLVVAADGHHRRKNGSGCHPWPLMGQSRHSGAPGILWHNANTADDYYIVARSLGIDDYSADDFRWVDAEHPDGRVSFPSPPTAYPIDSVGNLDQHLWCHALSAVGTRGVCGTALHSRLLQAAKSSSPVSSKVTDWRLAGKISQSAFDILRWLRVATSPISPYAVTRTYDRCACVSRINSKKSVRESVATPRDECFARFVCQKTAERQGLLLVIGDPPTGLLRQVGQLYKRRLAMAAIVDSVTDATVLSANAVINGWGNVSVATPLAGNSLIDCLSFLPIADELSLSLILVNVADRPSRILEAALRLIGRDKPHLLIMLPDKSVVSQSELDAFNRTIEVHGYSSVLVSTGPHANGTFQPLVAIPGAWRKAIYAAPSPTMAADSDVRVTDASLCLV